MHVSGLVITLVEDDGLAASAVRELQQAGPFEIGERFGPRLAVVLETSDAGSAQSWHEWAAQRVGIQQIDVVSVHFECDDVEESPSRDRED